MGYQPAPPPAMYYDSPIPFGVNKDQLDQLDRSYQSTWDKRAQFLFGLTVTTTYIAIRDWFSLSMSSTCVSWQEFVLFAVLAVIFGVASWWCYQADRSQRKITSDLLDTIRKQKYTKIPRPTSDSGVISFSEIPPAEAGAPMPPNTSSSSLTSSES